MPKLILVSGWATPKDALTRFSRELSKNYQITPLLIEDLIENPAQQQENNSLSIYASNLFKIMNESKDPFFLMGWSMGGMIALEVAHHFPEKILGLILVSTSPSFCRREDFPHGFPEANVRALSLAIRKDPQSALIGFYRKVCDPHPTTKEREENWLKGVLEGDPSNLHKGLNYLMSKDLRHAIHKINIPSLIIHGRQDSIIPWQAGEWLSKNLPHSSIELSETDGHDLPMRKPIWLVQKLEFFKEVHA
jgi:pimeloyl-[acyl-carrier protein] methyl ester esterase